MNRREFLKRSGLAAVVCCAAPALAADGAQHIAWTRGRALFTQAHVQGSPLVPGRDLPLLDAFCAVDREPSSQKIILNDQQPRGDIGGVHAEVSHHLHDSGLGHGEDLLEIRMILRNGSDAAVTICTGFITYAQPGADPAQQKAYLPLAASGLMKHPALRSLGYDQEKDPDCAVGRKTFAAHYLEPLASDDGVRHGRAMLLAPVIDIYHPGKPWRVAMFAPSDRPRRFGTIPSADGPCGWSTRQYQTLRPGESAEQRCFLLLHDGQADVAWRVFHRFAHVEDHAPIAWLADMRVHYYDFLSAADPAGPRGGGYDADLPFFRQFRVGLATQHGYYPTWGDYIHPDRKTWQAMRGDKRGPVAMSFDIMKSRIAETRKQGAKAGVYMHLAGFDDASPAFNSLRDAIAFDERQKPIKYPWQGPDTAGANWSMSIVAEPWRKFLLQQAQWIMEILKPDAIVMDETFSGLGYDENPGHRGCKSAHAIAFFRELRKLIRSFGEDRALLTSDCSLSSFVLWADGEAGDHAYSSLLGHPLYRKSPVRYMAALGAKPWRPCAWQFQGQWQAQMDLARQVRAGVGVSNGWIEYTGLSRLPEPTAKRLQADIATL